MEVVNPIAVTGIPHVVETDAQRRARLKITEPAELLYNHAAAIKKQGHFTAAAVAIRRAIGMCPDCATLWNGLGALYWDIGDYASADDALKHAAKLGYSDPLLHSNQGLLAASMEEFGVAAECFKRALDCDPNNLHTKWNLAHLYLESGDWERGLAAYEIRAQYRGVQLYPKMPYPMWRGEDLTNKTIYIQVEQGAGDRILFSRYLHWLHNKYEGVRIKLLLGDDMVSLFWKFLEFVELVPNHVPWPAGVDYGCFLLSLPYYHGTTVGNVYPDPGLIKIAIEGVRFVPPQPRVPALKVGVCWTGNPQMARNAERSIPFPLVLELEDNPEVQLYGVQFGAGREQIKDHGAEELITDLVPLIEPRGYLGTAAAILNLDLVITACTSVAHLAGALGVPCWVLLCHDPYWVWLRRGDTSVWYPSVRLYRQNTPGDWGPVIDRVKVDLANYASRTLLSRAA